jgi:hypothetical protein
LNAIVTSYRIIIADHKITIQIWNIVADNITNGDCCFNHIIVLPKKEVQGNVWHISLSYRELQIETSSSIFLVYRSRLYANISLCYNKPVTMLETNFLAIEPSESIPGLKDSNGHSYSISGYKQYS